MTLYLHIGLNKTGTSSIQTFFNANHRTLESLGVVYPRTGLHDSAHYGFSKRFIGFPAAAIVSPADGVEDEIKAAVAADHDVVISSEYLFLAKKEQVFEIKHFLDKIGVDAKIVVYLRRHDYWIDSVFNQAVKAVSGDQSWDIDIREYFIYSLGGNEFEIRYPKIVDRWAEVFGKSGIVVRPFEASQFYQGDLVWDFCRLIHAGLPAKLEEKGVASTRVNESVPDDILKIIGAVRRLNMEPDQRNAIVSQLLTARKDNHAKTPVIDDGKPMRIPRHLRQHIVHFFQDDYEYIARAYLGYEDGKLFKETPNST